jgi:hypothetical protein
MPADSADTLVIARAQEINLSLNGDFADVTYPPENYSGTIVYRCAITPKSFRS